MPGSRATRRRRAQRGLLLALAGGLSLLLWAKLKLVREIPRTAYAEPRAVDRAASAGTEGE